MDQRTISLPTLPAPLNVTRHLDTLGDNRGFIVDEVRVCMEGEKIGSIKIENVPAAEYRKRYPTVFNYMAQISGISGALPGGYKHLRYTDLGRDDLIQLICRCRPTAIPGSPDEYDVCSMDDLLVIARDIEQYHVANARGDQMRAFRSFHVDRPFVAYIEVDLQHRRKSVGTLLYVEADTWMRERGYVMRSSGTQTKDAAAVWSLYDTLGLTTRDTHRRRMLRPRAGAALMARMGATVFG